MTADQAQVNGRTPKLGNVARCMAAMERAMNRPKHLPGLVCFYGPSGWGKSTAAAITANHCEAYYVEAKSTWTKKAVLSALLKEMGVEPARTIYEMADQAAEQLVLSRRPLIVDELDHLVEKSAVEILRDIFESSKAPILLIGEERLPLKLKKWERFHGRVLSWVPAQPADLNDAKALRDLYCAKVHVETDLLQEVTDIAKGSVRRICVNLEAIQEEAANRALQAVDLATWKGFGVELYTGEAPVRRVA